MDLTG